MIKKPVGKKQIAKNSQEGVIFVQMHLDTLNSVFTLVAMAGLNPNDFFMEFLKKKQEDIANAEARLKISKVPLHKTPEDIQ